MSSLEEYLKKTGQTFQELMSGSVQYGPDFILNELVVTAIKDNKKIVWKPKLVDGQDVGLLNYELQPI